MTINKVWIETAIEEETAKPASEEQCESIAYYFNVPANTKKYSGRKRSNLPVILNEDFKFGAASKSLPIWKFEDLNKQLTFARIQAYANSIVPATIYDSFWNLLPPKVKNEINIVKFTVLLHTNRKHTRSQPATTKNSEVKRPV